MLTGLTKCLSTKYNQFTCTHTQLWVHARVRTLSNWRLHFSHCHMSPMTIVTFFKHPAGFEQDVYLCVCVCVCACCNGKGKVEWGVKTKMRGMIREEVRRKEEGREEGDTCYIMSHQIILCHMMSCNVRMMSCHVMACHVMSCHVMSCHVMSSHLISDPVMSCYEKVWGMNSENILISYCHVCTDFCTDNVREWCEGSKK